MAGIGGFVRLRRKRTELCGGLAHGVTEGTNLWSDPYGLTRIRAKTSGDQPWQINPKVNEGVTVQRRASKMSWLLHALQIRR